MIIVILSTYNHRFLVDNYHFNIWIFFLLYFLYLIFTLFTGIIITETKQIITDERKQDDAMHVVKHVARDMISICPCLAINRFQHSYTFGNLKEVLD